MPDDDLKRILERKRAYGQVFGGEAGRIVLGDLYAFCGLNAQMHVPGDPCETAFRDGARRVALRIQNMLSESEAEFVRRHSSLALDHERG
jgi:hypothetical protein